MRWTLPSLIPFTASRTLAGVIQLDAPATSSLPHLGWGQNGVAAPCACTAPADMSAVAATAPPTRPAVSSARRSLSTGSGVDLRSSLSRKYRESMRVSSVYVDAQSVLPFGERVKAVPQRYVVTLMFHA